MSALPKPDTIPPVESALAADEDVERHGRFRLVPLDTPVKPLPRPYLVDGLIYEKTTFLIYGQPQAGKSFAALDLVLSVIAGTPWMGCKTEKGLAVYVASEGRDGIPVRVAGWKAAHSVEDVSSARHLEGGDFNLTNRAHVDDLIAQVNKIRDETDIPPKLVVIDTLSSAIPGADENNQATMSTVMIHLRRIAVKTGAAVGLVHHVSKGNSREPRGNNALVAGMDTSLLVTKKDSRRRVMEVIKQRDGSIGRKIVFDLVEQTLECEGGETATTTCVPRLLSSDCKCGEEKQEGPQRPATALLELAMGLVPQGDRYRAASTGSEIEVDLVALKGKAYAGLYAGAPSEDAKRKRLDRDLKKLEYAEKLRRNGDRITILE